jgi:integrase/recombinase XerC
MEEQEHLDPSSKMTEQRMKELMPAYLAHLHSLDRSPLTIAAYRQRINSFVIWRGEKPLNLRLLQDYKDYLQLERMGREGEGCRPRTIRLHFAALASFWLYASSHGYRDLPPIKEVNQPRLDKERVSWVNGEQALKLVRAAAKVGAGVDNAEYRNYLRWRAEMVITLGLALGLRRKDIITLRKADYIRTAKGAHLRIRASKGNETRTIPVPAFCREKFEAWIKIRDARCKRFKRETPALMIDRACHSMGDYALYSALAQVVEAAGLSAEHIRPHALRHGCATFLLRMGVDPETVRQILGHANIATTWKYVHTDYGAMERAMDEMGERLSGERKGKQKPRDDQKPAKRRPPFRSPRRRKGTGN